MQIWLYTRYESNFLNYKDHSIWNRQVPPSPPPTKIMQIHYLESIIKIWWYGDFVFQNLEILDFLFMQNFFVWVEIIYFRSKFANKKITESASQNLD
jgi:hypothetical protein